MIMSYSYETNHYKIPSAGFGDFFDPDSERLRAQIIDNQLYGSILAHSVGHGVLKEGIWVATYNGGDSTVSLNAPGVDIPAIRAFINQTFVQTFSSLTWANLSQNISPWYLYIIPIETNTQSTRRYGNLQAYSGLGYAPNVGLLVATALVTPTEIILDINPIDKIRIYTVADHAALSQDPHGQVLEQTFMAVSGLNILQQATVNDLVVAGSLDVKGSFQVDGEIDFNNGLTVKNHFTVSGLSVFSGLTIFAQSFIANEILTSSLDVLGPTTFTSPILCGSGIGIDGVDISELQFLIDGSNADWNGHKGHVHDGLSGLGISWITFNPVYKNTVEYDRGVGDFVTFFDGTRSWYRWESANPIDSGIGAITLATRITAPSDMKGLDNQNAIVVGNRVDGLLTSGLSLTLYDTEGNQASLVNSQNIKNSSYTQTICSISGNPAMIFDRGNIFTVLTEFTSFSGTGCWLSDLKINYVR